MIRPKSVSLKSDLSLSDRFVALSYRIFQDYADKIAAKTPQLKEEILKSDLHIAPQGLVSLAIFLTMLTAIIGVIGALIGCIFGLLPAAFLLIAPLIVFLTIWDAPKFSQSLRAARFENELPFLVGFVAAMAGGGVSPITTLRRVAELGSIFPASSKEAKRILVDIDVFGLDPISALEKAAKYNPNKTFAEFLNGYVTTLKMGGDHVNYLNLKLGEIYEERGNKIKRTSETIGMLAESYIILTAVLGISLFAVYQTQSMLSNLGNGLESLLLFSFVGIPLLSFIYICFIDQMQCKQPFLDRRTYKLFLFSVMIGVPLYFILTFCTAGALSRFLIVAITLAACVTPSAVSSYLEAKNRYALEKMLPIFLKDIAEGRKMGLSPEKCIESLASRSYGNLTKHIRKMSNQLSWGLPISKVLSTFNYEVKSWLTKVIGSIIMEVILVGGGTLRSFVEMSRFTYRVDELERSRRSSLKPYIFIAYFAAILTVFSLFLTIFFITQPLKTSTLASPLMTTQTAVKSTIDLLLTAAVFQSWVIGLVAGKMGEGSVARGFIHSLILVMLTVASGYFLNVFIPLSA